MLTNLKVEIRGRNEVWLHARHCAVATVACAASTGLPMQASTLAPVAHCAQRGFQLLHPLQQLQHETRVRACYAACH